MTKELWKAQGSEIKESGLEKLETRKWRAQSLDSSEKRVYGDDVVLAVFGVGIGLKGKLLALEHPAMASLYVAGCSRSSRLADQ